MLNQDEIDRLLEILKHITHANRRIDFPKSGHDENISVESIDRPKEVFRVVINNKSKISGKCTFINIHRNDNVLLRLDIRGPKHIIT